MAVDGMAIAGAIIEAGTRKFSDYAKAMISDFGDGIKPYLLSFYEAVRAYPGVDTVGMSSAEDAILQHRTIMMDGDDHDVDDKSGPRNTDPESEQVDRGINDLMVMTQETLNHWSRNYRKEIKNIPRTWLLRQAQACATLTRMEMDVLIAGGLQREQAWSEARGLFCFAPPPKYEKSDETF
jgi:hypothetical protein